MGYLRPVDTRYIKKKEESEIRIYYEEEEKELEDKKQKYLQKIIEYIPTEIVGGYIFISQVTQFFTDPKEKSILFIFVFGLFAIVFAPFWILIAEAEARNQIFRPESASTKFRSVVAPFALIAWILTVDGDLLFSGGGFLPKVSLMSLWGMLGVVALLILIALSENIIKLPSLKKPDNIK